MNWEVYIIRCSDNSLYTGISKNAGERFQQHARQRGAKYFRQRSPENIVYLEKGHTHSSAAKRESQIKKLTRAQKLALLDSASNQVQEA